MNEVQSRHEDIKKIEKTLVELFQLFQDMAIAVEEQDEQIVHIEQTAEAVVVDMQEGHKQIEEAKKSAQGARKKRKICFCIIVVLLLIIGGVVAYLVVGAGSTSVGSVRLNTRRNAGQSHHSENQRG